MPLSGENRDIEKIVWFMLSSLDLGTGLRTLERAQLQAEVRALSEGTW